MSVDSIPTGLPAGADHMTDTVIIWEFAVRPEDAEAFERMYGPDGPWCRLFREAPGYRGTTLLRDSNRGRYLTLDRWADGDAFHRFVADRGDAYRALDGQGCALTISERLVGMYTVLC